MLPGSPSTRRCHRPLNFNTIAAHKMTHQYNQNYHYHQHWVAWEMEPGSSEMEKKRKAVVGREATTATMHKRHKNYNQYPYPLALSYQRTRIIIAYICTYICTYAWIATADAARTRLPSAVHCPLSGHLYGHGRRYGHWHCHWIGWPCPCRAHGWHPVELLSARPFVFT